MKELIGFICLIPMAMLGAACLLFMMFRMWKDLRWLAILIFAVTISTAIGLYLLQ